MMVNTLRASLDLPRELAGRVWLHGPPHGPTPRHTHDELEMNLVRKGRAVYLVGSQRVEITRHTVIWLFPEQDHVLVERSRGFEMWIAVWRQGLVKRWARGEEARDLAARDPGEVVCRQLPATAAATVDALSRVVHQSADAGTINAGLAHLLLHTWQAHRQSPRVNMTSLHPAVSCAVALLRVDPTGEDRDAFARRCGLSATRLSRLFKEQVGLSLSEFRNRQRVERFVEHCRDAGEPSLIDAAFEAGFGSYPQFHRVFTRLMGMTPGEFVHTRLSPIARPDDQEPAKE